MGFIFLKTLEAVEKGVRTVAKEEFAKAIKEKGHIDYDTNRLYIPSGDMSDESLYVIGDFEPEYNDDIECEINYVEELSSIGFDENDDIFVVTDMGCYTIDELSFSSIMLLAEYVSYLYLEDKNEAKK